MDIIDAKGLLCPRPLILTKKTLQSIQTGERFMIVVDNATARDNILHYLADNGDGAISQALGSSFEITVTKQGTSDLPSDAYCTPHRQPTRSGHIIVIKNNKMGQGSEELGAILIQGFINTIKEISPLPEKIIFYNAGVKLAAEGSPVLPSLLELEAQGVELLSCGTCLDYYQLKTVLQVGKISNMYTLMEAMTNASLIIEP